MALVLNGKKGFEKVRRWCWMATRAWHPRHWCCCDAAARCCFLPARRATRMPAYAQPGVHTRTHVCVLHARCAQVIDKEGLELLRKVEQLPCNNERPVPEVVISACEMVSV